MVLLGSRRRGVRSTPSRSGGFGIPATAAMVGYKSTDSTRDEETPAGMPGEEIMRGTRVPNSKLVCLPQMLCSLLERRRGLKRFEEEGRGRKKKEEGRRRKRKGNH